MLRRRSHGVRILGFAHTAASGMKAGSVVDLVEAEEMIRQAIDTAESMAGVQLESVVVSLSGGRSAASASSPISSSPTAW